MNSQLAAIQPKLGGSPPNAMFANTIGHILSSSIDTESREYLLTQLTRMRQYVREQYIVAKKARGSEVAATATGLWEVSWGLFESLAEGVCRASSPVSMGLLVSKVAYTLTSGEELASALYLTGNYGGYVNFLKNRLAQIDQTIFLVSQDKGETLNSTQQQVLNIAKSGDYSSMIKAESNNDANHVIFGMQLFNFIILAGLSIFTLMRKRSGKDRDARIPGVRFPKSWIEPVERMKERKTKIFEGLASGLGFRGEKKERAGEFLETASISVPMGVLAVYKYLLSHASHDRAFSNTLFAQSISHVACFVGGVGQGYHALAPMSTAVEELMEDVLTLYEAGTYFLSSGKLLRYILHPGSPSSLTSLEG